MLRTAAALLALMLAAADLSAGGTPAGPIELTPEERAWIELFHPEDYSLHQGWVKNVKPMGLSMPTYQYRDLDPEMRRARQREWNEPILWPAYALGAAFLALLIPGIRTYFEERQ